LVCPPRLGFSPRTYIRGLARAERNHDIRIPGFASDETRFAASQTGAAAGAGAKKAGGGTGMTLRSQRLQQVQQAKRDGKLL
jgi:transcription initiation factor TFIID subunit 12